MEILARFGIGCLTFFIYIFITIALGVAITLGNDDYIPLAMYLLGAFIYAITLACEWQF